MSRTIVQPSANSSNPPLTLEQRARLLRSARKLGSLLGANVAPVLVERELLQLERAQFLHSFDYHGTRMNYGPRTNQNRRRHHGHVRTYSNSSTSTNTSEESPASPSSERLPFGPSSKVAALTGAAVLRETRAFSAAAQENNESLIAKRRRRPPPAPLNLQQKSVRSQPVAVAVNGGEESASERPVLTRKPSHVPRTPRTPRTARVRHAPLSARSPKPKGPRSPKFRRTGLHSNENTPPSQWTPLETPQSSTCTLKMIPTAVLLASPAPGQAAEAAPTPLTASYRFVAPTIPAARRKRMAKVAKTLGEKVPVSAVFPPALTSVGETAEEGDSVAVKDNAVVKTKKSQVIKPGRSFLPITPTASIHHQKRPTSPRPLLPSLSTLSPLSPMFSASSRTGYIPVVLPGTLNTDILSLSTSLSRRPSSPPTPAPRTFSKRSLEKRRAKLLEGAKDYSPGFRKDSQATNDEVHTDSKVEDRVTPEPPASPINIHLNSSSFPRCTWVPPVEWSVNGIKSNNEAPLTDSQSPKAFEFIRYESLHSSSALDMSGGNTEPIADRDDVINDERTTTNEWNALEHADVMRMLRELKNDSSIIRWKSRVPRSGAI